MINKVGGRKAAAGITVLAIGVAIALLKGDVPAGLLQLLQVVFGAFVIGNSSVHIARAVTGQSVDSETSAPGVSEATQQPAIQVPPAENPYMNALAHIAQQNEDIKGACATTQQGVTGILNYIARGKT